LCFPSRIWLLVLGHWFWIISYYLWGFDVCSREKNITVGIIDGINKLFDHRIRLGIMSILVVNEDTDFNRLKELLEVTDGNLASHLKTLESAAYISVEKSFIDRKPNTRYSITKMGNTAFKKHIEALEKLIN